MPMPDGTYWVAKMGGEYVGGLFPFEQPAIRWRPGVLDVLSRRRRRRRAGKKSPVSRRNTDATDLRCPRVGRIAILKEPGGAGVGWMTPAKA
jgi:hypothetical protein